ncbi:hypothetical protein B0H16DRAFT_858873 [Mycena metata]|uniref:Uncharacterized protein n=1 Tax=Mycena metata TaxID=1033252 RepID=A0AAD7N8D1_9AGAR|nr:hypothetical protein B0H16DRAFT_858873 [Mycena metata]
MSGARVLRLPELLSCMTPSRLFFPCRLSCKPVPNPVHSVSALENATTLLCVCCLARADTLASPLGPFVLDLISIALFFGSFSSPRPRCVRPAWRTVHIYEAPGRPPDNFGRRHPIPPRIAIVYYLYVQQMSPYTCLTTPPPLDPRPALLRLLPAIDYFFFAPPRAPPWRLIIARACDALLACRPPSPPSCSLIPPRAAAGGLDAIRCGTYVPWMVDARRRTNSGTTPTPTPTRLPSMILSRPTPTDRPTIDTDTDTDTDHRPRPTSNQSQRDARPPTGWLAGTPPSCPRLPGSAARRGGGLVAAAAFVGAWLAGWSSADDASMPVCAWPTHPGAPSPACRREAAVRSTYVP